MYMDDFSAKLEEYLSQRYKPQNINQKHKEQIGFQDRIAIFATKFIGTMYAVYFTILFLLAWMLWQTFVTSSPIDPYPFAFLLFMASVAQLPLMSLIMVSQNLLGKHAEIRAEEEFKTTNSTYKDIEKILKHLGTQDEELKKISKALTQLTSNSHKE